MKIEMSKQEARRITIIEELLAGRFTNKQAAELLDLSVRQVQRMKAEASKNGVISVLHKNRGRKPANALDPQVAEAITRIYQKELSGYNFCHATDVLAEEKGIFVSVSTVSRYLKESGVRSPKAKRRPKKHRSRNARECEGEMAQMDASSFDWLGNGSYLHLHGAVDDATGRILALHFEKEETFEGYCELMFQMNQDGHLPREIYTDGRTVFVYDSKKKKKLTLEEELAGKLEKQPNFARALKELNILHIVARSAQAKGGIERLWETLQDRLAKDMQRKGITSIEQANEFLKHYIPYYNRKFAVQAANPDKAYLPKHDMPSLQLIFAKHETRKLDSGLSFSFKNQKYCLPIQAGNKKVPASPHDTITVATSKHIGMQVLYKGLILKPELLKTQPKASIVQISQQDNSCISSSDQAQSRAKSKSPWFGYTEMFYSKRRKDDISAAQLSR
ncbi:MAG: ISNCY family transposase [Desulfotomaculaceae bacterium]|nr:ISNCY family transposase [Desulfotomaculaceae bacterium]